MLLVGVVMCFWAGEHYEAALSDLSIEKVSTMSDNVWPLNPLNVAQILQKQ